MRFLFKQKLFSKFDSYDILDENDSVAYTITAKRFYGCQLYLSDADGNELGNLYLKQRNVRAWFGVTLNDEDAGTIFTKNPFLKPRFVWEEKNWAIQGDLFWQNFTIYGENGNVVATFSRVMNTWHESYVLEVYDPKDVVNTLMMILSVNIYQEILK